MPGFPKLSLSSLRRRNVHSGSVTPSAVSDNNGTDKNDKSKRQRVANNDATCGVVSVTKTSSRTDVQSYEEVPTAYTTTSCGDDSFVGQECLKDAFYDVPCEQLARALLGKILVRRLEDGHILKGRIVETECYLGGEDKASHSFKGKMTERNAPMFMKPGTAYVYFTYGMYHCFNISSQGPGAAVLIRAVEPIQGLDVMAELRGAKQKQKKALKPHELCNGPSKLCIAFAVDRDACNKRDLAAWPGLSVSEPAAAEAKDRVGDEGGVRCEDEVVVVATKRVGIDSAGREWADKPLRFYLMGNASVSKRDRAKEKELAARSSSSSSTAT